MGERGGREMGGRERGVRERGVMEMGVRERGVREGARLAEVETPQTTLMIFSHDKRGN